MIVLRELVGLMRLNRLAHLRRDADAALRNRDTKAERQVLRRLRASLGGRPDLAWGMARLNEHEADVRDPGDLLALADRERMTPLDAEARRMILGSAKRVSLVTALSPIALIAVGFVLTENLRLLRRLATLYGGRPGFLGGLRLARAVFVHMVATGGIALSDDIVGQFIGHDLVQRLSRRLGEGLFNGALTARVGTSAIEVCRPLPYVEATPVRLRDIVAELMRRAPRDGKAGAG
jgi:putative membrane protein